MEVMKMMAMMEVMEVMEMVEVMEVMEMLLHLASLCLSPARLAVRRAAGDLTVSRGPGLKTGRDDHVRLAGLDSLVQDHGLRLEGLHKVRIVVVQPAGLGVELVAPVIRLRSCLDPTLGREQFSLQQLLA